MRGLQGTFIPFIATWKEMRIPYAHIHFETAFQDLAFLQVIYKGYI